MAVTHDPYTDHEESDVNIAAVFRFGGGLAAVILVVGVVVWLLFKYFDAREATGIRAYPLAAGRGNAVPPEPRLQERPREELRELQAREDGILSSYAWVDREAGTVRIPIAEAMRITVERGLPVRPSEPAAVPPPGARP